MSKKISLSFFALTISFLFILQTQAYSQNAQSATKTALLKELVAAMELKKLMTEMMDSMMPILEQTINEQFTKSLENNPDLNNEEGKKIKESSQLALTTLGSTYERLKKRIDFGAITEDIAIELYGKYFSEEEIKDLIAFYKSSTGRRILKLAPQISQESMIKMNAIVMPATQEIIQEMSKELKDKLKKTN